ncbi:hypothetical protein [Brevibacterium ammoniilyticum]|uniref:hypothetical protein n=1 Tax=Brevibacterium ammoniilyticum TaxID=1046555 RepID=UPI0031398D90
MAWVQSTLILAIAHDSIAQGLLRVWLTPGLDRIHEGERHAKIYSDEFNQSALDLINDGMTQKQVCADLGISKSAFQA